MANDTPMNPVYMIDSNVQLTILSIHLQYVILSLCIDLISPLRFLSCGSTIMEDSCRSHGVTFVRILFQFVHGPTFRKDTAINKKGLHPSKP